MLWIDQKYLNLLSPKLERFKRKSDNLYNCRCPICGDSKKNKFKGWNCYAGIDGLFINELGLISGAACLPEGKDEFGSVQWLGRIDKPKQFRMRTDPYICEKNECFCNTDLILSKFNEAVAV